MTPTASATRPLTDRWARTAAAWAVSTLPIIVHFSEVAYPPMEVDRLIVITVIGWVVARLVPRISLVALAVGTVTLDLWGNFLPQWVIIVAGASVVTALGSGAVATRWTRWPTPRLLRLPLAMVVGAAGMLMTLTGLQRPAAIIATSAALAVAAIAFPAPFRWLAQVTDPLAVPFLAAVRWADLTVSGVFESGRPLWQPGSKHGWRSPTAFLVGTVTGGAILVHLARFEHLEGPTYAIPFAVMLGLAAARNSRWAWPAPLFAAGAWVTVAAPGSGRQEVGVVTTTLAVLAAVSLGTLALPPHRPERTTFRAPAFWSALASVLTATVFPDLRVTAATVAVGFVTLLPQVSARLTSLAERTRRRAGRPFGRVRAFMDKIGRPVGGLIGAVVMVPVAVIVSVSAIVHRLLGFDVLGPPTLASTRWVSRSADAEPESQFVAARVTDPRGPGASGHRMLAGIGVVSVWLLAATTGRYLVTNEFGLPSFDSFSNGGTVNVPILSDASDGVHKGRPADGPLSRNGAAEPARINPKLKAGQSLEDAIHEETRQFAGGVQFDPHLIHRARNFTGKYINYQDGMRTTWAPPSCDCTRRTVWLLGGSAAWGFYQRDDFTPASMLAKQAWNDGVALDITNYASPGLTLGQEVQLFANLSVTEPAPDLVIFYDGANEIQQQIERNNREQGDDETAVSSFERELDTLLRSFVYPPPEGNFPTTYDAKSVTDPEMIHHAMVRYGQETILTQRLAKTVPTKLLMFWQPMLPSSPDVTANPDKIPSSEAFTQTDWDRWKLLLPAALAELPAGVIDLSKAFDDVKEPIFEDNVHTNERGAELAANALYANVKPLFAK